MSQAGVHGGLHGGPGCRSTGRAGQFDRGRTCRPLQRVEDRLLRDPVPALEIRDVRVQRRDRRQRMGQVIEHDDEVGLDECRHRDADRVTVREWHARLERADGVVGESADRATREAGHAFGGQDLATRDERADGCQWIGRRRRLGREVAVVGRHGDGPGLDVGEAIANLEESTRTDAQERVASQALAALDRLQQVRGAAIIEAQKGADGGLEVGRAGRAQQDRVGGARQALRLGQAERIGCGHSMDPWNSRTASRLRDERPNLPRCHPHSAYAALMDARAPGPIPSSSSFRLAPTAGSLVRRHDGYSSRSLPALRDVAGSMAATRATRQARGSCRTPGIRIHLGPSRGTETGNDGCHGQRRASRDQPHLGMKRRPTGRGSSWLSTGWRRGWDSNPRSLSTQRFSRAPPSTARPPLRPLRIPAAGRMTRDQALITTVPAMRSNQPRWRLSMKIQMNPR